ncbi:indole-3-glycerol phosphate synthase TrpC [Sessilibacter sp. MAH4]
MNGKNTLLKIVFSKREHVKQLKSSYGFIDPKPKRLSFKIFDALKKPNPTFILECKKASPSKGIIRQHFHLPDIINIYNKHAGVISVLTDEEYFHGSFHNLAAARSLTRLPILCKDFIIDEYQIKLAALLGADAILLMLSILSDDQYRRLHALADQLGLEIITEISNFDELERAKILKPKIVGINNRDLRTLQTDINKTVELSQHIDHRSAIISESGITDYQDICKLSAHANGFLIGSHLMMQPDLENACDNLLYGTYPISQHGALR